MSTIVYLPYIQYIYTTIVFEWDDGKNAANIAKHGIDFEEGIGIFDGPVLERPDDRRDYGERRIVAFGVVEDRELAIVYTVRGTHCRIIQHGGRIGMSAKHTVTRTRSSRRRGKTDWARVDALSDRKIEKAARSDPNAAPLLDRKWFANATLVVPEPKVPVSLRIDREVLDWFKSHGARYQSRMNAVLKAYMQAHRKVG